MKTLKIILLIGFAGTLLASSTGYAKAREVDLKSDLELELEGEDVEKMSQPETPPPKPSKPTVKVDPFEQMNSIDRRIKVAQAHFDRKEYDQAIETLKPVIDQLPRSGLLILAKTYAAKGDMLNEIRTLELCIVKNPKDYVVKTSYGHTLVRAKRVEDALVAFQQARELNDRYRPAYEAMLQQLEAKGERYEARNVVTDMMKAFGNQAEFYTMLCRLYWADSYHEKTVELCEEAIKKAPKVPENHVYLGLALKEREQTDKADKVLKSAAKRFPASEPVQSAMGELYQSKKDHIAAYNFFKKGADANPQSARAWEGYAVNAFKLQKNEEALKAFVQACKVDRMMTKEFRLALGELRVRKDHMWQAKFELGINSCQ